MRAEPACAPWPGEPDPLPRVGDADLGSRRWAGFRATQLVARAEEAEPHSRALAHALWQHVACLDPERAGLAAALERTRPVRVRRPLLERMAEPTPGPRGSPLEAAARLDEPVALWSLGPRPPAVGTGGPAAVARAEQALAEARSALGEARFEEALQRVDRARGELPPEAGLRDARAELEVVAATAALALGREADARASFERALDVAPGYQLDPAVASPKVYRLFRSVRDARPAPPVPPPPSPARDAAREPGGAAPEAEGGAAAETAGSPS